MREVILFAVKWIAYGVIITLVARPIINKFMEAVK